MMRRALPLFCLVVFPCLSFARPVPGTDVEALAWNASEIVVASANSRLDGNFTVLEVITGSLKPDEKIHLNNFNEFRKRFQRGIYPVYPETQCSKRNPVICTQYETSEDLYVTGRRVFLFLKRDKSGILHPPSPVRLAWDKELDEPWKRYFYLHYYPAHRARNETSIVWIENSKAYATGTRSTFDRFGGIEPLDESEESFRAKVSSIVSLKKKFNSILSIEDEKERSRALGPIAISKVVAARGEALSALTQTNDHGARVLADNLRGLKIGSSVWYDHINARLRTSSSLRDPSLDKSLLRNLDEWLIFAEKLEKGDNNVQTSLAARDTVLLIAATTAINGQENEQIISKLKALLKVLPIVNPYAGKNNLLKCTSSMYLGLSTSEEEKNACCLRCPANYPNFPTK